VETVDATLDNLSFIAYRRVSTAITVPAVGIVARRRQMIFIDPLELKAALTRDAEPQPTASAIGRQKQVTVDGVPRSPPRRSVV
jgi:hypothetical protein